MIKSFDHKGLERFFVKGSKAGIQANHAEKLRMQLTALHTAVNINDMRLPGWQLHSLSGERKNTWSISVNGNWRVTFVFENGHAYIVNYEDYH
ncbi:MAG: type II toxin-antitoxin system RelE/ParE family toxin [Emcibacter sp.]|nr:type II toxin-antitoxin system RelE/ParE family toxin [Emcibacter sp.]